MDRRIKKTKNAIKEAFLQMRQKKELEKISIKELCDLADINKSTFYTHYHDIYDLSSQLGKDAILRILQELPFDEPYTLLNPEVLTKNLLLVINQHRQELEMLFSGKHTSDFGFALEKELKRAIFQEYPSLKEHAGFNVLLSYCIQGSYHAQIYNPQVPVEEQMAIITTIVKTLQPLFEQK